jgi:hypothetical protein
MQHSPSLPVAYSMPYFSPPNTGEYPSIGENIQVDPAIYYVPNSTPPAASSSELIEHTAPKTVTHLTSTAPVKKAKALTTRELVLLLSTIGIGSAAGLAYLLKDPKKVSVYFSKFFNPKKLTNKTQALASTDLKTLKDKASTSNKKNSSSVWKGLGSVFGGGLGLTGLYHFAFHKDAIQNRENALGFGKKLFALAPNTAREKAEGGLEKTFEDEIDWPKNSTDSSPASSPKIPPQKPPESPSKISLQLDSSEPTGFNLSSDDWDNPWSKKD